MYHSPLEIKYIHDTHKCVHVHAVSSASNPSNLSCCLGGLGTDCEGGAGRGQGKADLSRCGTSMLLL